MAGETGYRANEGTPEQLPRGQAEALNENTNVVAPDELEVQPVIDAPPAGEVEDEVEEDVAAEIDMSEMDTATAEDWNPLYDPMSEDETFIMGPTTRLDEPEYVGTEPRSRISRRVRAQLAVLQRAAEEPGASAELKALVAYMLREA